MTDILSSNLMEPFSTTAGGGNGDESNSRHSVDIRPSHFNTVVLFGNNDADTHKITSDEKEVPKKTIFSHNFYITSPWSPQLYFTARGAENFHIYLWIAKDLCWIQYFHIPAMVFGSFALSWSMVLFYNCLSTKDYEDAYMLVGLTLWLAGNFVWMHGEVTSDDDAIVGPEAAIFFETAIAWLALYYIALRPLGVFPLNKEQVAQYEQAGLKPRFSYFKSWRQYEYSHTVFWIGKDYSWNMACSGYNFQYVWVIFVIPTILVAMDFMWTTYKTKSMTIDLAHYSAQLIWVIANIVWAGAEVFGTAYDDPKYIFHVSPIAQMTARWYSSWIVLFAYLPIFMLFAVWIPLTCYGRLVAADVPENKTYVERASKSFIERPSQSFMDRGSTTTKEANSQQSNADVESSYQINPMMKAIDGKSRVKVSSSMNTSNSNVGVDVESKDNVQ